MKIRKQRGLSIISLIVVLVLLIFAALLVFKVIPPYIEYFKIQKTFKTLGQMSDLQGATHQQVEAVYVRYQLIDSITAVGPNDLEVSNDGGQLVVSAQYSVKVPLVSHLSLLMEFTPSSAK